MKPAMENTTCIALLNGRLTLCVVSSFLLVCFVLISSLSYNHHRPSLSALRSLWIAPMTAMSEVLATGSDSPSNPTLGSPRAATNIFKMVTKNKSEDQTCGHHRASPSALEITETKTMSEDLTSEGIEKLQMAQTKEKCDIFNGRWVYDPKTQPLYEPTHCPFLSNQVTCRKNGRPDHDYEQWRWEVRDCKIPRFNGTDMLERLRGKRVIIVGDSLNRNMWESLACLLYSAIPSKNAKVDASSGDYKLFKAKGYDCSVEFYWNPFLVQLEKPKRILKLDKLHVSARRWHGANIMVFNTGHWWTHTGKMQVWDLMQDGGKMLDNLPLERAFQLAMKTWADWIDRYVDPAKTTVFFRSISPEHKGKQWCYNQTHPMKEESYKGSFPRPITDIVENTIREMKTTVKYLNITKLSRYRIDAHSTIYTTKAGKLLNEEQRKQPELYADCSHWCLPGLPDTWNSLLYASTVLEASRGIL